MGSAQPPLFSRRMESTPPTLKWEAPLLPTTTLTPFRKLTRVPGYCRRPSARVNVAGGTGPNHGAFGTLGRNTFRGPAYRDFDLAVIKDTPFGRRGREELGILQFRAEFFNIFNLVNFGLPSNIVRGSGFGINNSTAGTSRQIQFSLRLIF